MPNDNGTTQTNGHAGEDSHRSKDSRFKLNEDNVARRFKGYIKGSDVGIADEAVADVVEAMQVKLLKPKPVGEAMKARGKALLEKVDVKADVDSTIRGDGATTWALGSAAYLRKQCDGKLEEEQQGTLERNAKRKKLPEKVRKVRNQNDADAMKSQVRVGSMWNDSNAVNFVAGIGLLSVILPADAMLHVAGITDSGWDLGMMPFASIGLSLSVTLAVVVNTAFLHDTWLQKDERTKNPDRKELRFVLAAWSFFAAVINGGVFGLHMGLSFALHDAPFIEVLRDLLRAAMPLTSIAALSGAAVGIEHCIRKHLKLAKAELLEDSPALAELDKEDQESRKRCVILKSLKELCDSVDDRVERHIDSVAADHRAVRDSVMHELTEREDCEREIERTEDASDQNEREAVLKNRARERATKRMDEINSKYAA